MRFTLLTTLVLATMAYAAPEADNGMTRIARSDIFPRQFGCVSCFPAQPSPEQNFRMKSCPLTIWTGLR